MFVLLESHPVLWISFKRLGAMLSSLPSRPLFTKTTHSASDTKFANSRSSAWPFEIFFDAVVFVTNWNAFCINRFTEVQPNDLIDCFSFFLHEL